MSKRIITINRMFGSNGHEIGKRLAAELGFHFCDKELIDIASKEKNIPFSELVKVDEKKASQWRLPIDSDYQIKPEFHFAPMNDLLFDIQKQIILDLAEKKDSVIVGRCANHILKDKTLSVFIHAPFETRVKNIMDYTGRDEKSASKLVKRTDKERSAYYEFFTDTKWTDFTQYNLCIDSSRFTIDQIVRMISSSL